MQIVMFKIISLTILLDYIMDVPNNNFAELLNFSKEYIFGKVRMDIILIRVLVLSKQPSS